MAVGPAGNRSDARLEPSAAISPIASTSSPGSPTSAGIPTPTSMTPDVAAWLEDRIATRRSIAPRRGAVHLVVARHQTQDHAWAATAVDVHDDPAGPPSRFPLSWSGADTSVRHRPGCRRSCPLVSAAF